MAFTLPAQHRTLQLKSIKAGFQVVNLSSPQPGPGSAIIRIEAAGVLSYHRDIYNGARHYSFPTPLVGGASAIGRIAAIGSDATALKEGQLVYIDCVIKARDDPDTLFLSAIHDSGVEHSIKLMRDVWRDGTFAEYAKFPLENCIPLNETRLCGELSYSIPDLMYMGHLIVPFGGLRDIALEPGETVIISPATGGYGGAGVLVALAMGARVIATGRNADKLTALKAHVLTYSPDARIETMTWTGNEKEDTVTLQTFGTIDAVLDLTPPQASKSLHLRSATSALRRNGRVSLMGFVEQPVVPWTFVGKNITVKGKLMYEREDIVQLVKMLERGLFQRGRGLLRRRCLDWRSGRPVLMRRLGLVGLGSRWCLHLRWWLWFWRRVGFGMVSASQIVLRALSRSTRGVLGLENNLPADQCFEKWQRNRFGIRRGPLTKHYPVFTRPREANTLLQVYVSDLGLEVMHLGAAVQTHPPDMSVLAGSPDMNPYQDTCDT